MSKLEVIRTRKPSLWDRVRSYTLGPLTLQDPALRKYFASGGETSTGLSISEYTALNYSAVWAAVRLISSDIAGLPLCLYRREGDGMARYVAHPLYRLLHDSPNPEMSSFTFRQTLQAHVLTWGNGYAEIERDGTGRPRYLWPLTPDRVTPFRDKGRLAYRVTNDRNPEDIFEEADIIHLAGLSWDGQQGYSPIAKARESVALGLAAEKFGGAFFGNGSTFGGVITHPTKFATEAARNNFEKSLAKRTQGVGRAHGLLLMEEGMTYQQMGIPPDQAQFLESRQFQIAEIARWFNVPPHKIGDLSHATFSNIEAQGIDYHQTTLLPLLKSWEQELERKLISPLERNQQHIEHVVEGLLRGDSQGRAALEQTEFRIGGLTPNESRSLANRNPVAGGEEAFVSMDVMPLSKAAAYWDAQIASLKANANPPPDAASAARIAALETEVRGMTDARDVVKAERDHAQVALRDVIDDMTAAKVGAEGLRAEVAAEQGLRIALEERVEQLTDALAVKESLLKDVEERLAIADGTITERNAEQVELNQQLEHREHRANELKRFNDQFASELAETVAARDTALADLSHTKELLDGAQTALAAEQAERAQERSANAEATRQAEQWRKLHDGAKEAERAMVAERNDLRAAVEALTGEVTARDAAIGSWKADAETARAETVNVTRQAQQALAEKVAADQRAEQATRDKDTAEAAQAAANATMESRRQHYAERITAALTAQRAVVVDAIGRMVRRETEKARRNQATPQKLRSWAESFYSLHEDVCRDALEPAVRVHLALIGDDRDPAVVTQELVTAHIAQSQIQLRAVVDGEPSEMHQTLERVLTRWESERAGAVGDRLLMEGVSHVRSIR